MNPPTLFQRGHALWSVVTQTLNATQPLAALAARVYLAQVFFLSGLTKIRDWETTLLLFTEEYKVPLLSPQLAAISGTAGELVLPVLLLLGLAGRFSALGLSVVNVVAVVSLAEIAPAALQQHITWGVLLAALAIYGVGRWSVDCLWIQPRLNRTAAPGMALN
ncbi:DoxX family protein [Hydrogenophaga sp.]|uniref:DoxX family protein n=1 Tax=Hydrogenophaga sp. TaxID=1904254 RepID=UPI00271EF920|nr:DoxX family protein [Hydrogenophaga sp.]MDO9135825.1 DoxX family protein [Hydrogenophaga sp.]MDP2075479.1 DoxX family protein [Hydrogenophaga sp.]MDP3109045.1 DoxX family protein [Hydrogenophaga sp.]MDP3351602.1 DoxX family protein [Hydrogenophaga sp.]MDZ4282749.1 DoxX family protein [Hydrogenophaga sp.]